jgi:multidrug transporter EmrE-like cation transporter
MTGAGLFLVILSSLLTVSANLMMRGGVLRAGGFLLSAKSALSLCQQPLFVTGFILYGIAALIWFRVLSVANLSTSYPLLVSLTFVLVTLGAVFFFREPVSTQKIVGIAVIVAGIVLVASS